MSGPLVSVSKNVITVTATTDAETIGDNKVICTGVEIANAFASNGGTSIIKSISVLDIETVAPAIDIVFSSVSDVITQDEGKAVGEDVAELATVLGNAEGVVKIVTGDYTNLVDCSLATKSSVDLVCKGASDSNSLFMHIINRSGGNWVASSTGSMQVKLGIEY